LEKSTGNLSAKKIIYYIIIVGSFAFVLFHLYTGYFGSREAFIQRSIHLLLGLVIYYLNVIYKSESFKDKVFCWLAIIAVVVSITYLLMRYEWITLERFAYVTPLSPLEMVLAGALILVVIDVVRRLVGKVLVVIVCIFLAYPLVGSYLPGLLETRQISLMTLFDLLYMGSEGIFGVTIGVSATMIALFIIFGAFITTTGAGTLLYEISAATVGKHRGGPAKIAVVASGLMGSISGVPTANVVTTGALTIPMMKRLGFSPVFAGAVEAAASNGGQFLPPIMGAVTFLMMAFTGIPYSQLMIYALIPALLYYFSVYFNVHLEAIRLELPAVSSTKTVKETLKDYAHLLIPIGILIFMLVIGYSPSMSGALSTVALIIFSSFRSTTRLNLGKLIDSVVSATVNCMVVMSTCAVAGIVIGVIRYTGLGQKISSLLVKLGGENLFLVLILVAFSTIILGMGMPPVPSYIMQLGLTLPALLSLGVPVHVAHFFVFYYCGLSLITPPIAVSAYATAGISNANPMMTGWVAFRMVIPSFVIPFLFVINPALMMDGSVLNILISSITAVIGIYLFNVFAIGYMRKKLNWLERILAFISAVLFVLPLWQTVAPGIIIYICLHLVQKRRSAQANTQSTESNIIEHIS
jgi:TRAP transporter 4TM/12TM fusion protein